MFAAVYFEEPFVRSKLPTVEEFYNVFHPTDMVSNRIEPLIKRIEYPDNTPNSKRTTPRSSLPPKSFIFSHERPFGLITDQSYIEQEGNYWFGDQILGPVLVPWYHNHGLCRP